MSWKQVCVRDERVEFVIRAERGEALSGLCREYGITRPTGYLWVRRYREQGVAGMEERSRRPERSPRQTPSELEARIVALRRRLPRDKVTPVKDVLELDIFVSRDEWDRPRKSRFAPAGQFMGVSPTHRENPR